MALVLPPPIYKGANYLDKLQHPQSRIDAAQVMKTSIIEWIQENTQDDHIANIQMDHISDDWCFYKHLICYNDNTEEATEILIQTLMWLAEYNIYTLVRNFEDRLIQDKVFRAGYCKEGTPILIFRLNKVKNLEDTVVC
eukprot:TRINITY_DN4695_c0_g1_i3.p1 TRINITY_DN4695_c0_g1~~TRINITY_DN4695_c0_g1_i3.p1  ORF type:complete len:139 (-),score=25.74 TRINITY_DN4695_c0_g1_i3:524-940(-)